MFLSKGVDYGKGRCYHPFPSVVFHGLLGTCSFLKLLVCVLQKVLFNFVITLISVLKSVTKWFLKTVLKSVCVKEFLFTS